MSNSCVTRGIDHVGITVPDLDAASRFSSEALGAIPLYDNITREQEPTKGPAAEKELDLAPGTSLITIRMMQLANGPGIELFEMKGPSQQKPARPSDFGLQHFAVYVDDIEAAAKRFQQAGGELITGPNEMLGPEKGKGNAFLYARTPWNLLSSCSLLPARRTTKRPMICAGGKQRSAE